MNQSLLEEILGFKLKFFVIVTKASFIILAICFSSVMIMSFLTDAIFIELGPLSVKYGLTFLQNSLLSATSLTFDLAKYCFLSFLRDSDKSFAGVYVFAS